MAASPQEVPTKKLWLKGRGRKVFLTSFAGFSYLYWDAYIGRGVAAGGFISRHDNWHFLEHNNNATMHKTKVASWRTV